MANNELLFSSLLYPVIIFIYFIIDYLTGKSIREEINNKTLNQYNNLSNERLPIIITFIIGFYFISNNIEIYNELDKLVLNTMFFLHLINYSESSITDPIIHKINRHTLRYSYLINLVCLLYIVSKYSTTPNYYYMVILLVMIALIFGFFTLMGIGPSDFRCFFITVPTYLVLFGKTWGLVVIILSFSYLSIYQFKLQRKIGKVPIPIGDKILLPLPLLTLLATYFGTFKMFLN